MSEHELEKLLGGFAADTLTPEEKHTLYSAALHDQQLFDTLADEQALKDLLADPDVRRKLLAALEQKGVSGAGGYLSWLDWFRRPAGLAFAGGLAAAALAVVLGTKIYQESLKQAAQSVATEESRPSAPPVSVTPPLPAPAAEPEVVAKDTAATLSETLKKEAAKGTLAKREQPAKLSTPAEHPVKSPARENGPVRSETDESRKHDSTPPARPDQAMEETIALADKQQQAPNAAPPAIISKPQPPASVPLAGAVASGPGARALFYGNATVPAAEQERRSRVGMAQEKRPGAGAMAEALQREKKRAERSTDVFGKVEGSTPSVERPLGLRYSVIMTGPGGIDMEVDPATPVGKDDGPRLAVQTNEDGYLSVLYARQSSDQPTALFPSSGDGRVAARKPVAIALGNVFDVQQTAEQIRLLIIFARTPRDVNSVRLTDENIPRLLIEQVDPGQPGALAEQAVYVVNPDPAPAAYLLIEVPLSLRP